MSHGSAVVSSASLAVAEQRRYICGMSTAPLRFADARLPLALVLAVSTSSLAAAFAGQHLFGIQPCVLCLYQRVPWAAAAVIALLGLLLLAPAARRRLLLACAAVFAAGAGLAFYHVGVEAHWWAAVTACGGSGSPAPISLDDLSAEALAAAPSKPCDQVDFRLLGLSLAGWNVVASSLAALSSLLAFRRLNRKPVP